MRSIVAVGAAALVLVAGSCGVDEHGGEDAGSLDPPEWLDVSRMATAAERIGAEMTEATGDETFTTCGEQPAEGLRELDTQVRAPCP